MAERCVCCGEIIPEGRQVCPICERNAGAEIMANEKRLIEANALRAQFDDIPPFIGMTGGCVQQYIDKAPTVDAAEVVRCGECGYSPDGWVCLGDGDMMPQHPTYPDRYCSCGRRRTENA